MEILNKHNSNILKKVSLLPNENLTHEQAITLKTDEEKRLKQIARTTLGKKKSKTNPPKVVFSSSHGAVIVSCESSNSPKNRPGIKRKSANRGLSFLQPR